MARLMERSRRHGRFDPRFRLRGSKPAAALDDTRGGPEVAAWVDEGGALRPALAGALPRAVPLAA